MATRKKLPNLKICVDNTESTDESDVEIQGSDSSSADENHRLGLRGSKRRNGSEDGEVDEEDVLSIASNGPTERRFLSRTAVRNKKEAAYGPKLYENKSGNFVTGVDISFEEATENWKKRAKKFGTLSTPKQPITDVDIKNLYKSLGMNIERLDEDPRGWRMEAILLRGTDDMSTKDVFDYFSEYAPKGVEWIDDCSCNVVWLDKLTPARALIKLSSSNDEVKIAEKAVDNLMGDKAVSKGDTIDFDVEDNKKTLESLPTNVHETTSLTENKLLTESINKEPVLNVLEEELMELDYDDNLDLMADDPIDQAQSTWSNFTQNKKQRAERASVAALRKSLDSSDTLSAKEQLSGKISEKEVDDSNNDVNAKQPLEDKDSKTIHKSLLVDNKKSEKVLERRSVNHKTETDSKIPSNDKKEGLKGEKKIKEKETPKKREKMETDEGSESDNSSSSSSSGSSSSGSSNSGSSSGSDSDFGSGSSSSSSSSSTSSTHSKQKKKKTQSERDQERAIRKTVKKPEAPPVPPPSREKSDIPWPPGWWRLGKPHPKAEYLFMRYAMKADKKLPGAEKRSKYYQKYGNPNFGGIRGLISNSRKRRLRNSDREEKTTEVYSDVPDMFKGDEEEEPVTALSRLSGRLGTKGKVNNQSADEGDFEDGEVEDDEEQPVLKEGKDLRDLLNKQVVAVSSIAGQPVDAHQDSDDEMDYGAELERLMGDNPPPSKKRFMRMHADDEEEKIERARRLARIQKETQKWPKHDLDAYQEDVEEEVVEEEEKYAPVKKEWVDYDNVEDDDPFNLFGTAKVEAPRYSLSDSDNDDISHNQRHRRSHSDKRDKTLKQRIGGGFDKSTLQRPEAPKSGVDLRAKLEGRRRAGNRNW